MEIVLTILMAFIAIYLVVLGFEGWFLTYLNRVERAVLIIASVLIPFPIIFSPIQGIIVGIVLIAGIYFLQKNKQKKLLASQPV